MVLGVVRVRTKLVARIVQATLALHNFIIKSGGGYIEVPENVLEQDMGQGDWADPEPELDFTVQNQVKEIVQDAYFDHFM